jgi:anti-sigma regulatory factor (Ser/Thr protein kinase)
MNDDAPSPAPPPARSAGHEVRTLAEARDLATRIASLHPDPDRVEIGLTELLVNAVEHGNLGITYEEKASLLERGAYDAEIARRLALPSLAARKVTITVTHDAFTLATRIEDEGDGFDWLPYLDVDPERALAYNGNGIAIAREMSFDELRYEGRGNVVVATVRLDRPPDVDFSSKE